MSSCDSCLLLRASVFSSPRPSAASRTPPCHSTSSQSLSTWVSLVKQHSRASTIYQTLGKLEELRKAQVIFPAPEELSLINTNWYIN